MSEPESPPTLLRDLLGFYSVTLLVLGRRTGALDVLLTGPVTPTELAARVGLDERNAREWLAGMAAAGYAAHTAGHFSPTETTLAVFTKGELPLDPGVALEFASRVPQLWPDVATAMRDGRGIRTERFAEVIGDLLGRFNRPAYDVALIDEWLASVPGVPERLESGIDVAELGCSGGYACMLVARAYPASRVVGFDRDSTYFDTAGLANLDLVQADVLALPSDRSFDLVFVIDALHHFADPGAVTAAVARVLRPDGCFVVVEPTVTGDLDQDLNEPGAVIGYAAALLYCMQDNLAAGGPGYGSGLAEPMMAPLFADAGLRATTPYVSTHTGYTVYAGCR